MSDTTSESISFTERLILFRAILGDHAEVTGFQQKIQIHPSVTDMGRAIHCWMDECKAAGIQFESATILALTTWVINQRRYVSTAVLRAG